MLLVCGASVWLSFCFNKYLLDFSFAEMMERSLSMSYLSSSRDPVCFLFISIGSNLLLMSSQSACFSGNMTVLSTSTVPHPVNCSWHSNTRGNFYLLTCICWGMYMGAWGPKESHQKGAFCHWSWSYRWLWAVWYGCWILDLNLNRLQEYCVFLTTEPFPQSLEGAFKNRFWSYHFYLLFKLSCVSYHSLQCLLCFFLYPQN